jgi:hypothetical protein
METLNYLWDFLLRDETHERVFRVIADELSFVQDYYFSSLPVSYSKYWLPILSISISLLTITYCILATRFIMMGLIFNWKTKYRHQLRCRFWCNEGHLISDRQDKNFGSFVFDDISLFFLIILVVLAEVKYIASYICSNWTKVALICHYINHAALQQSFCMRKCFGFLLQCNWERILKHWDEKMGQSSILVVNPRTTPLVLLRRLLRLPDLDRSVEIPDAVKVSIFDTLQRYRQHNWHRLGNGTESLRRSPERNRFLLFCHRTTSDTILTWHIATCILELYQNGGQDFQPNSNHKVTSTHLSRYCTYLMAWSPDLLPDDDEWSKSLYEAVKEDSKRALVGFSALALESEYEQVVRLLGEHLEHEVLRNGVRLAEQLVELTEGEAWMMLAEFWSEMILYIAPSENVRGHLGAIARGGELITLLWALLTHAGIMRWPADTGGTAIA